MTLVVRPARVTIVVVVRRAAEAAAAVEVVVERTPRFAILVANDDLHRTETDDGPSTTKTNIRANIDGKFSDFSNSILIKIEFRSPPPRQARDQQERRRSPRPPPTVQQSTQRTIVYMQESSHST